MLLLALPPPHVAAQLGGSSQRYLTLWPIAYGDTAEETAAALAPLESCPVLDRARVRQVNTRVSFDDLFAIEAGVFPEAHRYDVEIIWSQAEPTVVLSGLRTRLAYAPSPKTAILTAITGPPSMDPSARAMAYSLAAPLYIGCFSIWEKAADDQANLHWHQETVQSLAPITLGHYMGETDLLASPTRAARSFAPGVWERVQAAQREFDPHHLFYRHLGQE